MRAYFSFLLLLSATLCASSQTADELVGKNLQARGGVEKIKAVQTYRSVGRLTGGGRRAVVATVTLERMRPNLLRSGFTLQAMTRVRAYDGSTGWQIQPFRGNKEPQLMGEDDARDLSIDADIDGPLLDYKEKGNTVEYLGHDVVDGDDALRLKVTLKDGDIIYYYLDPDTYLEIRKETQQFIRGAVKENVIDLGSYKPVAGVMYPFSLSFGPKNDPSSWATVTVDKIEINSGVERSEFAVPASLKK
ncbi:MAG TPA: hypothetical protein VED66_08535 [Candidatus Sulfotelmatobacter sp.]|nr:hypothetical protein [Candidatus Sulfotelmatobacter sp.]